MISKPRRRRPPSESHRITAQPPRAKINSERDNPLVCLWLKALDVQTFFIDPGSPWENDYVEFFNGMLRDELLDRKIFYTLTEATVLIERWRREYNTGQPDLR